MSDLGQLDVRITAALIAATFALAIAIPNAVVTILKFRADANLARRTDAAIRTVLRAGSTPIMPFNLIRHHIGGLTDDELRKALLQAGAVRFADVNMVEHWGLLSLISRLDRKRITQLQLTGSPSPPRHRLFPATEPGLNKT